MENIGKMFGSWTVKSISQGKNTSRYYICECSCGIEKSVRKSSIVTGKSLRCRKCQNLILSERWNIIGEFFNSWKVLEKQYNADRQEWFYLCECECGNQKLLARHRLENHESTRCKKCHNKTHGMSYTSTYKIWREMIRRCTDEKSLSYKYYGGRGISVCQRWLVF